MNIKSILAAVAGAVVYFLLGWLIYGTLLMGFFEANSYHYEGLTKEMPNLLLTFLSNLATAGLLAFIFKRWASITTFKGGLIGGLIIGAFIAVAYDLYLLAAMNLIKPVAIIADIVASTAIYGIIGGVVGWILGYGKKETA